MSFWRHIFGWRYDPGVVDPPTPPPPKQKKQKPAKPGEMRYVGSMSREEFINGLLDPKWQEHLRKEGRRPVKR